MAIKHNDNQTYTFDLKKKKKIPDLPTAFFDTCFSKHNFFFRLIPMYSRKKKNKKKKKLTCSQFHEISLSLR